MSEPNSGAGEFVPVTPQYIPWCHLTANLDQLRVALVTTAGVYLKHGLQAAFAVHAPAGDPSFRELPGVLNVSDLAVAHPGFDTALAAGDPNVVFPLERLRQLARLGIVGEVAPLHYSFMGHAPDPLALLVEGLPAVTERLRRAGVGAALIIAASALDHQTAGLIARGLEAAGIPTLVIGTLAEWLRRIRAPRAVWMDHAPGAPLGEPGNGGKHQEALKAAIAAMETMTQPGSLRELPFKWRR